MRNIYKLSSPRAHVYLMRALAVVAIVALAGLITHGPTNAALDRHGAIGTAVAADRDGTAAPTPYFPSQYELHAGPPEAHIEAF
jgi:hypothetical protein